MGYQGYNQNYSAPPGYNYDYNNYGSGGWYGQQHNQPADANYSPTAGGPVRFNLPGKNKNVGYDALHNQNQSNQKDEDQPDYQDNKNKKNKNKSKNVIMSNNPWNQNQE